MRLAILSLLLALALAQDQLLYLSDTEQLRQTSPELLRTTFLNQQSEIHQKVFTHFADDLAAKLSTQGLTREEVQARFYQLVTGADGLLWLQLQGYMQQRLFDKLGKNWAMQKWGC